MNDSTYHSLREQIEGLLTESRQQTRQAGEWEKVETYWQIGDALTAHIDTIPGSKHGQQIVRNLSKDLKLGYTTLYQILRFRRVIDDPKVYARTQMGWSHFRALIHLKTPQQIRHYAKLANQENWTTRQLKRITFCLPGIHHTHDNDRLCGLSARGRVHRSYQQWSDSGTGGRATLPPQNDSGSISRCGMT